jgi:transposase
MKTMFDKDGYVRITLTQDKKKTFYQVHRLIALTFIENPENKPQVNHKDGIKENNFVNNLEWATEKEQQQHALDTGLRTSMKGGDHFNAVLTDDLVVEIFKKYSTGNYKLYDISEEYGVSISTIQLIISGKTWKHLNLGSYKKRDRGMKITKEIMDKIIELYNENWKQTNIAKELCISEASVSKVIKEYKKI